MTPKAHFALKYLSRTELPLLDRLKVDEATSRVLGELTKQMIENSLEKKVKSLEILKQV